MKKDHKQHDASTSSAQDTSTGSAQEMEKDEVTSNKKPSTDEAVASKCANCDDADNKYKRALADYSNLLKRTAKEKEEFFKYSNEQLIVEMIPVYDNLKTSLEHTDDQIEKSAWLEGVKYVLKQFKSILESIGVEEIKTVGEKFDHNTMEAVSGEGEMVVKEGKPGYKLNGKVIVPARVIVGN